MQARRSGTFWPALTISLVFCLFGGCKIADKQVSRSELPEAVSKNLVELTESYCAQALSHLAPSIPAGVKPLITRVNPYPALPDYRMFPDASVRHLNAKAVSLLAKCVHQKCLDLPNHYEALNIKAVESDCGSEKANAIVGTFIGLANSCRMTRYLKVRALQTVQDIFEAREGNALDVCPD